MNFEVNLSAGQKPTISSDFVFWVNYTHIFDYCKSSGGKLLVTGGWRLVSKTRWYKAKGIGLTIRTSNLTPYTLYLRPFSSCDQPQTTRLPYRSLQGKASPPVPLDNKDSLDHIGTVHGFSSLKRGE